MCWPVLWGVTGQGVKSNVRGRWPEDPLSLRLIIPFLCLNVTAQLSDYHLTYLCFSLWLVGCLSLFYQLNTTRFPLTLWCVFNRWSYHVRKALREKSNPLFISSLLTWSRLEVQTRNLANILCINQLSAYIFFLTNYFRTCWRCARSVATSYSFLLSSIMLSTLL